MLGRDAVSLNDLDQWLDLGVIVVPVRPHTRGRGVRDDDAAVRAQVLIKTRGAPRVAGLFRQEWQRGRTPVGKQNVAVPIREADRPLVAVERLAAVLNREDVDRLLQEPIDVFVVGTTVEVVLAGQHVVKAGRIKRIAVSVE